MVDSDYFSYIVYFYFTLPLLNHDHSVKTLITLIFIYQGKNRCILHLGTPVYVSVVLIIFAVNTCNVILFCFPFLWNVSIFLFQVKNCTVRIVDDGEFEPEETLTLNLADPQGTELSQAKVGTRNKTTIVITNYHDGKVCLLQCCKVMEFSRDIYFIHKKYVYGHIGHVLILAFQLTA